MFGLGGSRGSGGGMRRLMEGFFGRGGSLKMGVDSGGWGGGEFAFFFLILFLFFFFGGGLDG